MSVAYLLPVTSGIGGIDCNSLTPANCVSQDPTAGPSASDQSTWYLDESTLSDNIKKTLHKFCGPSPVVFR